MSVQNIAQAYVDGYYPATNGLTLNDAVHVLASQYGLHKGDLRVAIEVLYNGVVEEILEESNASVEGDDALTPEAIELFKNYP